MLFTFSNGLKFYIQDYFYNYSSAKETAEYIINNLPENSVLYTDNVPYSIAVVHYLDGKKDIYSVVQKDYVKYVVWDDSIYHYINELQWDDYAKTYMKEKDYRGEKLYLLFSGPHKIFLNMDKPKNYKLIFESKPAMARYEIYKVFEYVGNSNNSKK